VLVTANPKYLNSRNAVFERAAELYLYQARRAIALRPRHRVVRLYGCGSPLAQSAEYRSATTAATLRPWQKLLRQTMKSCFVSMATTPAAGGVGALETAWDSLVMANSCAFVSCRGEDPIPTVGSRARRHSRALSTKRCASRKSCLGIAKQSDLSARRAGQPDSSRSPAQQIPGFGLRLQMSRRWEVSRLAPDEVERLCETEALAKRAAPAQPTSTARPDDFDKQLLGLLLETQLLKNFRRERCCWISTGISLLRSGSRAENGGLNLAGGHSRSDPASKHFQLYEEPSLIP